ncbi:dihydrofolate reductase family protein [Patescibacteria group bacterium]|nr:dihydrofolate reductase family protein [Patescibacteria group bacterium]
MKVSIIASITVDGFIAQNVEQSSLRWTSKEDTKFFVEFTKKVGVLIMGSKTFETINRPLPDRKIIVLTRSKKYDQFSLDQVVAEGREIREVLEELKTSGQKEVAITGGTSIYTQFMKAKLVDELYLTVEPIVFGSGLKLFNESLDQKLELIEIIDLSRQTKVLHYKIIQ